MTEQDYTVRVLGMEREDCFAIAAIDHDIWGYGETPQDATDNLVEHLRIHIRYLQRTNRKELIHNPSPNEFITMYNECLLARMQQEIIPGWWISSVPFDLFKPEQNPVTSGQTGIGSKSSTGSGSKRQLVS